MVKLDELKQMWTFTGMDVEKLIEDIQELLTTYNHRNSKHGIIQWLAIFIENKKEIIEMIMKSPNYNGNLQIVLTESFNRDIDTNGIYDFISYFCDRVSVKDKIVKFTNKNGQTFDEIRSAVVAQLPNSFNISELQETVVEMQNMYDEFNYKGEIKETSKAYNKFKECLSWFTYYYSSSVNSDLKNKIDITQPEIKLGVGMKTSRAFNKICNYYGVTECSEYNTEFPKYADMINTITRDYHYVISVNPIDYLKMSFGNTWASCHTIDRNNVRNKTNAYRGDYCGGTLSYMLDPVSIINYVVPITDDGHPEKLDKIYRNMFHYQKGALVQGRVYPQAKDGATDLYEKMRSVMQREISSILNLENLWVKKGSTEDTDWIFSIGKHYPDYNNFSDCNLSIIKELKDEVEVGCDFMTVGHRPVCAYCGESHELYSNELSREGCSIEEEE